MSHPEAPTLCWCFNLDILNHNMVNTYDTFMITYKYRPAENRFPPRAAQNCQLQHYCATFCTPVHNAPAVNQKLLKIEQAQTNLKWSILSCDFQKYWS